MIAGWAGGVRAGVTRQRLPRSGLWTIVLAAGGSRRFGSHKLLARLGGRTLLQRAVDLAGRITADRCVVVLGCQGSRLAAGLSGTHARIVVNRRWREGMATSLAAGVSALPRSARAALITLGDQFAVGPDDLERLVGIWSGQPARAAAAGLGDRPVAPAVLPRRLFPEVLALEGDRGARDLLLRLGDRVTIVDLPAASRDVDERRDLAALRRHARSPMR